MGLDAYFYIKPRFPKASETVTPELLTETLKSAGVRYELERLKVWAEKNEVEFEHALCNALSQFNASCDATETFGSEALYFRKFHFLLEFFGYDDDYYAKDMVITRAKCEELLDRAKKCLNDVEKYLKKQKSCVLGYDDFGVLISYTVTADEKTKNRIHGRVNQITNKAFPCRCSDSYFDHVSELLTGIRSILRDIDWDTECVVFNADW